jgi:hypothetical protein
MTMGSTSVQPEVEQVVLRVLESEATPVPATVVKKRMPASYKGKPAETKALLDSLVDRGQVFMVGSGKTPKYTRRAPREILALAILEVLAAGPLAKTELKRRVKKQRPGLDAEYDRTLVELVQARKVHPHHGWSKTGKRKAQATAYALEPEPPPDLRPFLSKTLKELRSLLSMLASYGVTPTAVISALSAELGLNALPAAEPSDEDLVRGALAELARREPPGTLIPVRALRQHVSLEKARFDRAVLQLSENGIAVIHHHDYPQSLSDRERNELVIDERGTYYVGIAPRRLS